MLILCADVFGYSSLWQISIGIKKDIEAKTRSANAAGSSGCACARKAASVTKCLPVASEAERFLL